MRKFKISFTIEETAGLAERHFMKNSGFCAENEKHSRMYKEAAKVREEGIHGIHIESVVAVYGSDSFQDHKFVADGMTLSCNAFSRIADDNVKLVYLYMITAGRCVCGEDETILKQLYADIWGTAYVDAGRDLLEDRIRLDMEEELQKRQLGGGILSKAFGPGFYGMPMDDNRQIEKILGGQEIGIEVRESGIMLPLKTCSGLYLVVENPASLPKAECATCIGNKKGCEFCRLRQEK